MTRVLAVVAFLLLACGSAFAQSAPQGFATYNDPRFANTICGEGAAAGVFRPECYTATGTGNTLVSQADAAFNDAVAYIKAGGNNGATVELGNNVWPICNAQQGWLLPQNPGQNGGLSIHGQGVLSAQINLTCQVARSTTKPAGVASNVSQAALWCPVYTSAAQNTVSWSGFQINAFGFATLAMDYECLNANSNWDYLSFSGSTGDGSNTSAQARWGNSAYPATGWTFQAHISHINNYAGGNTGNGFVGNLTINSSTGVPTVTVTNGGSGYSNNAVLYINTCAASVNDGNGGPGILPATVSGGAITGFTNPKNDTYFACTSGVSVHAFDPLYPVHYGIWLDNLSDSFFEDVTPVVGEWTSIYINTSSGSNTFVKLHPTGIPIAIEDLATQNTYLNTEMDGIGQIGWLLYANADPTMVDTEWLWTSARQISYTIDYAIQNTGGTYPTATVINDHCGSGLENLATGGQQFSFNFGGARPANFAAIAAENCNSTAHTKTTIIPGGTTLSTLYVGSSGAITGAGGATSSSIVLGNDVRLVGTPTAVTAAGTTQATATVLANQFVTVTTTAAGQGVKLAGVTTEQNIGNNIGGNALLVYPPTGGTINGGAANAPVTLPPYTSPTFRSTNGTAFTYAPPAVPLSFRTVTAATDTPTSADNGFIAYNSTSAQTVTVNDIGAGGSYSVQQQGTGQLSLVAGSGVTLTSDRASPSFQTALQWASLTVICNGAGTCSVIGNMK